MATSKRTEPKTTGTATMTIVKDMASSEAFMGRLIDEGIRPHAEQIASIIVDGRGIAVVVYELRVNWHEAARMMGWDGEASIFRLTRKAARRLATLDAVTARWVNSKRPGRILVLSGEGGTLLLNFTDGVGFSIEPGSTDESRVN
jgi:hypothetical protein